MGSFSIFHWIVALLFSGIFMIPMWRICTKAGFSGWVSLAFLIPVVNIIALWLIAFVPWPAYRPLRDEANK